jgi:hypothetical protein
MKECTLKTGIFRIVASLFAAVSLVAAYFAAEFYHETSTSALARNTLSDASRMLLEGGNPSAIPALAASGSTIPRPDVEFLREFGDLIAMEQPDGEVFVPPLFSSTPGNASLRLRASFAYGTADVAAQLSFRDGEWRLLSYTLTPGAGVM